MQTYLEIEGTDYSRFGLWLIEKKVTHVFVVCGKSAKNLRIYHYLLDLAASGLISVTVFNQIKPNPTEDIIKDASKAFYDSDCDIIIAIGGGSAIDVAKGIVFFDTLNLKEVGIVAIPTTAGSGSEATQFAVYYSYGVKKSIDNKSCLPQVVVFDYSVLQSLPLYQRKSTMLDALCHAVESFWSIKSTALSKEYASKAIKLILGNREGYLSNNEIGNSQMLLASNYAGKAINITRTTAGHALCYSLSQKYGLAHGHSAAICLTEVIDISINSIDKCCDQRGKDFFASTLQELIFLFGGTEISELGEKFAEFVDELDLDYPVISNDFLHTLTNSVNLERLNNNPIRFDEEDIMNIYRKISRKGEKQCKLRNFLT